MRGQGDKGRETAQRPIYSERPHKVFIARTKATRQSHEVASLRSPWQHVHTLTIPFTVKGQFNTDLPQDSRLSQCAEAAA
jgi:hypothetical protein